MTEEKGKRCNFIMLDNKPCGRPLYDDEHCIFHSKDIESKKDEFYEQFWKEFERQKKDEDKYDFSGFVFPGDISFEKIEFEKYADFGEVTFYRGVFFGAAKFRGKADFWKAKFRSVADFEKAEFFKEALFREARFSEGAISGGPVFRGAHFNEGADFRGAHFFLGADFGEAKFFEEADFEAAQFYCGIVLFGEAQFSKNAIFREARFSDMADFGKAQFSDRVDFFSSTFSGKKLEGLFASLRNRGIKRILKGTYKIKDFRFHLGEKIAKEYPVIDRMTKDAWYLDDFKNSHPCIYKLWWLSADCGRSFLRWALWSLGIALFFAILYLLIGPDSFKPKPEGYTWFSFFYYSFVTFTTLGFGDITPIKWYTEILVTIEVTLGYIMLGGLISILANKLARRS